MSINIELYWRGLTGIAYYPRCVDASNFSDLPDLDKRGPAFGGLGVKSNPEIDCTSNVSFLKRWIWIGEIGELKGRSDDSVMASWMAKDIFLAYSESFVPQ